MAGRLNQSSPYYIDNRKRVADLQKAMEREGLDAYVEIGRAHV